MGIPLDPTYLLKRDYSGKGLATEAAAALLHSSFSQLGLASLHGGAASGNLPSMRVMEKPAMRSVGRSAPGGHEFVLPAEDFWKG